MQKRVTVNLPLPKALLPAILLLAGLVAILLWQMALPVRLFLILLSIAFCVCCYLALTASRCYGGKLIYYRGVWRYYDVNNAEVLLKKQPALVASNENFLVMSICFQGCGFSSVFFLSVSQLGEEKSRWIKRYFLF